MTTVIFYFAINKLICDLYFVNFPEQLLIEFQVPELDALGQDWMGSARVGCTWPELDALGLNWMQLGNTGCNGGGLDAWGGRRCGGGEISTSRAKIGWDRVHSENR